MSYNAYGYSTTRPYRDETLDLDKSRGSVPEPVISEYQRVIICGITMEQYACDILTGDALFRPITQPNT